MAKVTTLAEMWWPLMKAPTTVSQRCAVCGASSHLGQHRMVEEGAGRLYRGGIEVPKPTITLCGYGKTGGCHGLARSGRLHFRWVEKDIKAPEEYFLTFRGGHLEYLLTEEPCDYLEALGMDGWKQVVPR